jgi:hypothetical protein
MIHLYWIQKVMNKDEADMTLNTSDYFSLNIKEGDSLFKDISVFVRNNGDKVVKVSFNENTITLKVVKS